MRLSAILVLCACVPSPRGECAKDADCAEGPAGSFCAESICQGPPEATLEPLPAHAFSREETLEVRVDASRVHGTPAAQVTLNGSTVDANLALIAEVPLSLAPAGVEGTVPIQVVVRDDLGHSLTLQSSVVVDDLPPRLTIDVPATPVLRGTQLSVHIEAQDLTAVSIDGAAQNVDGSFTLPVDTASAPAGATVFDLAVSAKDAVGNRTTQHAAIPLTRVKWIATDPEQGGISDLATTPTTIFAQSHSLNIWILDRATGVQIARPLGGAELLPSMATDGDRVFFGREDNMMCRMLANGTIQACCGPFATMNFGPILDGTTAIVATSGSGTTSQRVIASLDFGTNCGTPNGIPPTQNFVQTLPAIGPDGVLRIGAANAIVATKFDGLGWTTPAVAAETPTYIDQPAFRESSTPLFARTDGAVDVFATSAPTILRVGASGTVFGPTIAEDGTAIVSNGATLTAFNPDGSTRWTKTFDDPLTATPTVGAGNLLYAGTASGVIEALDATTGSEVWSVAAAGKIHGPIAIGCDGILYAGAGDTVIALVVDEKGLANSPWPKAGHDIRNTGDARRPMRDQGGGCSE